MYALREPASALFGNLGAVVLPDHEPLIGEERSREETGAPSASFDAPV